MANIWQRSATTRPTTLHVCKTIGCQCSFRLLMMGGVSPETCWASCKYKTKILIHCCICWIFFVNYIVTSHKLICHLHSSHSVTRSCEITKRVNVFLCSPVNRPPYVESGKAMTFCRRQLIRPNPSFHFDMALESFLRFGWSSIGQALSLVFPLLNATFPSDYPFCDAEKA